VFREPWEQYTGDKSAPLLFVERDAAALAYVLNRVGHGSAKSARVWEHHWNGFSATTVRSKDEPLH
jgi:hypothetical protein